ncbi:hypothetical protein [Echinicola shivajiensis]|uniref:hypothetical protein n=1 Tax=Echinicola shivajiensis TaxID=1035916 RepID=UPI001BFC33CC|nr:hypothetical protein [Echinicola shivajiensis]
MEKSLVEGQGQVKNTPFGVYENSDGLISFEDASILVEDDKITSVLFSTLCVKLGRVFYRIISVIE